MMVFEIIKGLRIGHQTVGRRLLRSKTTTLISVYSVYSVVSLNCLRYATGETGRM